MTGVKKILALLCAWLGLTAFAAEVIPPVPAQYFNDYAGVVSAATAAQLNQRLEQFERDAASQIVVAIYPKMQSDSSIEDYTVRVAQAWHVGQKDKDNGAVLFVFTQDRKMFLQVGYGLEGALPDALCKRIIADEITPQFKAGNFDAGLTAGVNAMLAAAKGEYKGTGRTVRENYHASANGNIFAVLPILFPIIFVVVAVLLALRNRRNSGWQYYGGGWNRSNNWSSWSGGGFSSGGGSGGFSGGGGGGFSSGGGSFGGGGAGGSW
jgi:uncharacterized protein